ncbi:unnamed protein product [Closterium sp. NIES-53]
MSEPGGAEPERVVPWGAEPGGAESGGAEPGGAEPERTDRAVGATGPAAGGASGAGAAGGAAGAGAAVAAVPGGAVAGGVGGVGGPTGIGAAGGTGVAGPGGARTGGTGATGASGAAGVGAVGAGAVATGGAAGAGAVGAGAVATGGAAGAGAVGAGAVATGGAAGAGAAGGTGAGGAAGVVAGDPGAEGTGAVSAVFGGAARPRPYYVPLLHQVLGLPPSTGPTPPESRPASPESRPESPVCAVRTGRRVPRQRPPPVPGTHSMTLHPSTAPQRVPLPSPPASSLPDGPDPESDSLRAASPTVMRFLATAVSDPSFESTAASALVAELVDFAAACRLDYAASLLAESESASICPPSVGGECALGTDVLEDKQEEFECFAAPVPHLVSMLLAPEGNPDAPDIPTPRSYAEAIEGPYSSQWQTAMDTEMASWKSTGTYVNEVPPPGANIVSGMWIFRVKRPPSSPPVFKARYVARGFRQRHGVDFFQTFSPTPKMTTLWVLLHVTAQLYVDDLVFATADTEALTLVKSELQKRHTCTDLGELRSYLGLQITRERARRTITLTQSHMVHQCTRPDLAYPLSLLARYVVPGRHRKVHGDVAKRVLRYLCSTSGTGLVHRGRGPVVLTGHADASWVDDSATQRSSQGYIFSLGSGSVSWRSTC